MSRYLVQIAYADAPEPEDSAGHRERLDIIDPIISDLGGRIEHHWLSTGEFDAVLIVETSSHGMAFDMAVAAHPSVKATRTTALRSVDEPPEGYESWCGPDVMQILNAELVNAGIRLLHPSPSIFRNGAGTMEN